MLTISAVIPTYNREAYLEDSLLSVLKQTHPVDEIIVVDDGSSDKTHRVVKTVSSSSTMPIKYIYQDNKGPAAARNTGISASSGRFVAFLDSDDLWDKRKVEKQLMAMELLPGYLISHTGEKWFRRGEHLNKKRKHLPKSGDVFFQCLELCAVGMSTVMVRRELFDQYGLFDETYPCCEDYEFWLRVSLDSPFLLIDKPLTIKHGGRDDQVSSIHRVGMDVFRINALEKIIKSTLPVKSKRKAAVREYKKKCQIYGSGCLKHGKTEQGREYLEKANMGSSE